VANDSETDPPIDDIIPEKSNELVAAAAVTVASSPPVPAPLEIYEAIISVNDVDVDAAAGSWAGAGARNVFRSAPVRVVDGSWAGGGKNVLTTA
jgi:hypothetical protein